MGLRPDEIPLFRAREAFRCGFNSKGRRTCTTATFHKWLSSSRAAIFFALRFAPRELQRIRESNSGSPTQNHRLAWTSKLKTWPERPAGGKWKRGFLLGRKPG